MLNLDPGKLLVIGVVAIILLGPDRLPQVARQIGGAWRTFNEFRHRMESEVRNTMPDLPPTSEIARLARSPSALLNHLSNMAEDEEEPDGSFQPPTLNGQNHNGTAGRADEDSAAAPAATETDGDPAAATPAATSNGADPAASNGADAGTHAGAPEEPAPAPPPATAPIHVEPPLRTPKPSGVVVPGDPTLN
jgi:sec-independent protein translocase protein TatB